MFEEGRHMRDRITKLCSSFLEPLYVNNIYFWLVVFIFIYRFEIQTSDIRVELIGAERTKEDMKSMIRQTKL